MRANTVADFWKKVRKGPGCWLWTRAKDQDGYGLFQWQGRMVRAPRFVVGVLKRLEIDGKEVRHTCDNPSCVRPSHLLVGTTADNAQDRESRGRGVRGRKQSSEHVLRKANSRRGKKWTQVMKDRMAVIKADISDETRAKMSEAALARDPITREHSEKTKKKIGDAHRGTTRSSQAIDNMRKAQRARFS